MAVLSGLLAASAACQPLSRPFDGPGGAAPEALARTIARALMPELRAATKTE